MLKRTDSLRWFFCVPTTYVLVEKKKIFFGTHSLTKGLHIDTISEEKSILYFKGLLAKCLYNNVFLSLKIVLLVNSADPDEKPPYAAFHFGLHCL